MSEISIASKSLQLTFSRVDGSLVKAKSLLTGWEIHRRRFLGLSWRLHVPIPGVKNNHWLFSHLQASPVITSGTEHISFRWNTLCSATGNIFNICVEITVRLAADHIVWETDIENHSSYTIESVCSPCIGDLSIPSDAVTFESFYPAYNAAQSNRLWPFFDDNCGYWGTDCATNYIRGVPEAPYVLLHDQNQGLFCGVWEDRSDVVSWLNELHPGFSSSMDYRVPCAESVNGKTVHFCFSAVHCPYIQPGSYRALTPIFLQAYTGDWQSGVDIYKAWLSEIGLPLTPHIPTWAKEPHSWLQYQINSPVDDLRMSFQDLPQLAERCQKEGINVIQLVGWNEGGQDHGFPEHRPDSRLGTPAELKEGIAACHKSGVKVILFAKFTWSDQTTEWFRNTGEKLSAKNPYGNYYWIDGYQYQTPTQQLSISSYPLIPMCFCSRDYRLFCVEQMRKISALGCDGILFDECQHHGPALLCFDKSHGHRPGISVYEMDRQFVRELREGAGLPDDFLIAGEACYDWESTEYAMSYHRSQDSSYVPVARYTRPFWPIMTAVTGFQDRNMINQCLLYRFIISYEPYHFKGFPKDCGETLTYGKLAEAFRIKYRKYIWDAEFIGTKRITRIVHHGDQLSPFSVFQVPDGTVAVLAANYSLYEVLEVSFSCGNQALTHWRTVEDSVWRPLSNTAKIPPQSIALFAVLKP